jgi:hypothetical protein
MIISFSQGLFKPPGNNSPINHFPEILNISRSQVLLIEIIGMFPYITGQDWFLAIPQRTSGI